MPGPVKGERGPSARERTARLLEQTAREQLREGGEMTVTAVAERAGVSRATAYRYFVSNDAVTVWATRPMSAEPGAQETSATPEPEELGERAARLVRDQGAWAFQHERELRALLALSLAPNAEERGVSRRGKMRRRQWIEDGLLNYLPDNITAEHRTRLAAALTPLFGSDAVVWTQDAAQLDPDQALDLMAWIARTLVEATVRDPHPSASAAPISPKRDLDRNNLDTNGDTASNSS
jgi:AcrR family transcriptional regulator